MHDETMPSGLVQLKADLAADRRPSILETLDIRLIEVERGYTLLEATPDRRFCNPNGSIGGGYTATLLDSACASAVQSQTPGTQAYTTLELKVTYLRALSEASGRVRAEGRVIFMGQRAAFAEGKLIDGKGQLCATASSTLLILERR